MHQASVPSLFELLARSWTRPAAIVSLAFNADRSAVAFAAADGSVAIVPTADGEPPEQRVRIAGDSGRMTIRPRAKPPRPAVVVAVGGEDAAAIASWRSASFAVAGTDGEVLAVTPRGHVEPFATRLGQRITALDHDASGGLLACAGGDELVVLADADSAGPLRFALGRELAAVAFSPDGRRLAGAHTAGVSIWDLRDGTRQELPFRGEPQGVSWSPDGTWLACPLRAEGIFLARSDGSESGPVLGYPTPCRSLAWSEAGHALVTAGAFRAVAWSMTHPPLADATAGALQTGRPGLVIVDRVAAHPRRDLIAVGYANGQVGVMQLGRRDELLLREQSGPSVTALAWSGDGSQIAVGAADGGAALIGLPPQLFK
jgi:WD40 repeat protein